MSRNECTVIKFPSGQNAQETHPGITSAGVEDAISALAECARQNGISGLAYVATTRDGMDLYGCVGEAAEQADRTASLLEQVAAKLKD